MGAFLTDLEVKRGASAKTRNLRLTAIRSVFRFVFLRGAGTQCADPARARHADYPTPSATQLIQNMKICASGGRTVRSQRRRPEDARGRRQRIARNLEAAASRHAAQIDVKRRSKRAAELRLRLSVSLPRSIRRLDGRRSSRRNCFGRCCCRRFIPNAWSGF